MEEKRLALRLRACSLIRRGDGYVGSWPNRTRATTPKVSFPDDDDHSDRPLGSYHFLEFHGHV